MKYKPFAAAVSLALALTACSQSPAQSTFTPETLDAPGVAPYPLSQEADYFLDLASGIQGCPAIFSLRSPDGTTGMRLSVLRLEPDGTWFTVEGSGGGIVDLDDPTSPVHEVVGTLALSMDADRSLLLNFRGEGTGFSQQIPSIQLDTDPICTASYFLDAQQTAILDEPIPLAIYAYDDGTAMPALDPGWLTQPSQDALDLELVLMITVEFHGPETEG